jgi:hypothetical protein
MGRCCPEFSIKQALDEVVAISIQSAHVDFASIDSMIGSVRRFRETSLDDRLVRRDYETILIRTASLDRLIRRSTFGDDEHNSG